MAQIEQAIEPRTARRLKEVAQLVLGKAAAAGLKDVAPQAARLFLHRTEKSWPALSQAVDEFAAATLPPSQSQAA